jgi:hypothetical protein
MGTGGSFPGLEAGRLAPSNAEVKHALMFTSTPPYAFIGWCCSTGTILSFVIHRHNIIMQTRLFCIALHLHLKSIKSQEFDLLMNRLKCSHKNFAKLIGIFSILERHNNNDSDNDDHHNHTSSSLCLPLK